LDTNICGITLGLEVIGENALNLDLGFGNWGFGVLRLIVS